MKSNKSIIKDQPPVTNNKLLFFGLGLITGFWLCFILIQIIESGYKK